MNETELTVPIHPIPIETYEKLLLYWNSKSKSSLSMGAQFIKGKII